MGRRYGNRWFDGGGYEQMAGYARAVRRGPLIVVSGTTANAGDGTALHPGDTGAQTTAALRQAVAAVEGLGGRREDVVRTRLYLTPDSDWRAVADAHAAVFGDVRPANTTVVVHSLIGDGFLVEAELEAIAEDADDAG